MSFIERFAALLGSPRRDPEIARAIAELSAYSDRELDELGIARGGIREAVMFGRPGLDRPAGQAVNDDRRRAGTRKTAA